MKTLANTSPFLLLLIPVFMMIVLTLTKVSTDNQNEDLVSKAPAVKSGLIKVASPFSR
ncbi:hypothetical protein [Pedobacter nyackensis]|uniref:hypothetical protein n=1 Tax=Pedobacter nyackensis TaxID=475255 RepID=UPI002931CB38|nr:hypothetical protein [Pedobacter nyackensis]